MDDFGAVALNAAVLRIRDRSGAAVGVGFLITPVLALTCAHVVSAALGTSARDAPQARAWVAVDLPLAGPHTDGAVTWAVVEHWLPPEPSGAGDIAVLRLPAPLRGGRPVRLVDARDVWGHRMRTFGFPRGREHGVWHVGRLRARQAAGWIQAELVEPGGYRVSGGFSGGPAWDEELAGVVGMVAVAETGNPPVSYLIPTEALLAASPPLRGLTLSPSPFRGLAAFRETDAAFFHGRAREASELADLVRAHSVTTLVGPSGCGKSSLAMAGVIPLARERGATAVVLRPAAGRDPLFALAAELLPLLSPDRSETGRLADLPMLAATLARQGLTEVLHRVLARTGAQRLLVVVDQFEELLAQRPEAVAAVTELLFTRDAAEPVRVLVTLRADFLEPALAHPGLGPVLARQLHALGPLSRDHLREVVTEPIAGLPGVDYEPGLVERILDDTGEAPGALPLLGFTLTLLWERQTAGRLTHHAYEQLGGVAGALGRHAEEVWREHVPAADEDTARRLFTHSVRLPAGDGPATRRVVARADVGEPAWQMAQRLATSRLLVTGRDAENRETVELAHEALITGWPRLSGWVEQDREFLGWRETLRHDMARWRRGGQHPELLPPAVTLEAAPWWLPARIDDLGEAERDYLARGRRRHRTSLRRRRAGFTGLGAIVMIVAVVVALYVYQRGISAEQAAVADSRALAQFSADAAAQDPVQSIMLALAAHHRWPTEEARNALLQRHVEYKPTDRLLSGTQGQVKEAATSADGAVVLAVSVGGRPTLFVRSADRTRVQHLDIDVQALFPVVTPDGDRMAYLALDGSVVWFDVAVGGDRRVGPARRAPATTPFTEAAAGGAAISDDGRRVAAVVGGRIVWWDLTAGTLGGEFRPPEPGREFTAVRFGADNTTVFGLSLDEARTDAPGTEIVQIDVTTSAMRAVVGQFNASVLPAGGDTVITCRHTPAATDDDTGTADYLVQRLSNGAEVGRYSEEALECGEMATDSTGRRLAVGYLGKWRLVDMVRGEIISTLSVDRRIGDDNLSRLVETAGKLFLVEHNDVRISLTEMPTEPNTFASQLKLTRDGAREIVVLGGGTRIQLRSTDTTTVYADAPRPRPYWDPAQGDLISLGRNGTLLADRVAIDRVAVREVSTLRQVAEITFADPTGPDGDEAEVQFTFDESGQLLTFSGTRVERWDAHTGRRLGHADVVDLGLIDREAADKGDFTVSPHPLPNHVAVTVWADPDIHVVDLGARRVVSTIRAGKDASRIQFDPSGRYFALLRRGSVVELWHHQPPRRLFDSVLIRGTNHYIASFLDDRGGFLVADGNTVRVYRIGARTRQETLFALGGVGTDRMPTDYDYRDLSADGATLIFTNPTDSHAVMLSLRPHDWQRALCDLIGKREFTTAERDRIPAGMPSGPLCV